MPEKAKLSSKYPIDALFLKAQTGDKEAVQAFFDQYAEAIRLVVRQKLKQTLRSAWDSDDFLQRARIKLLQADLEGKHFETPQALIAYLATTAQREVMQEQRKQTRRGKPMQPLSHDPERAPVYQGAGPATALSVEDQWRKALAALPPRSSRHCVAAARGLPARRHRQQVRHQHAHR